jgi:hypothetical protein
MQEMTIIRIYSDVDEFCKVFQKYWREHLLTDNNQPKDFPRCSMSLSEVMTIVILFHLSGYRCFKWFYLR